MRVIAASMLCGVGFAAMSAPSHAQVGEAFSATRDEPGEIVVTARRRGESLQDVPQTVNAVTSQTIEKLNLQNFKDIAAVVPGLTLSGGVTGSDAGFSLRGVSFNTLAQTATPTVQFYVNEVPTDANMLFQSMYDVGQIEVLRGPQGTLRGRSAPSGAITLTTRKPSLTEVGGYVNMTGTERGNINANAAISLPLVRDVLAVRVAGLVDRNDLDGVRSVNNRTKPRNETESLRASVLFAPTDNITASVTYQYLAARYRAFQQVIGFASPFSYDPDGNPATSPNLTLAAGGPAISVGQRLAVSEGARETSQRFHLVTGSIDWRIAGQKLSYVGSYQSQQTAFARTPQDLFNVFPGFESIQNIAPVNAKSQSHEVRLANENPIGGFLDYTIGGFYSRSRGIVTGVVDPAAPVGFASFVRSTLSTDNLSKEISFFGSVTAHIGEKTEFTGGARHINYDFRQLGPYSVSGAGTALCNFIPAFQLDIGCLAGFAQAVPVKDNAWVWNASLSHRLSDDFLVYGSAGTSYRPPFAIVFLTTTQAPGFENANDLRSHPSERSTGFEMGFKSSFFDKRVRLNVAGYHQKFTNHSFYLTNIPTYDVINGTVSSGSLTATANAVVWGIDADAAFQITPRWSLTAGFAWARGRVDHDDIPCRDSNFDGVPDNGAPAPAAFVAAGKIVARCASNQSISTAPPWSLTLQSEYAAPISGKVDGFVRGLFTYYAKNSQNNRTLVLNDYGLLNVYAGIRSPNSDWEVSLFAKNLTNTVSLTSASDLLPYTVNFGGGNVASIPVNYRSVTTTPRREFGLNVRYVFGSR